MKTFFKYLFLIIISSCYSQVQVRGYYRSNGTYVQPHVRTAPNSTLTDNYSYPGNYNPNIQYNNTSSNNRTTTDSTSNNNSSSETVWVNGYYRKDGTYVSGYYRRKSNTESTEEKNAKDYNNNTYGYSSAKKKYVNTTKVNFRSTPYLDNNIIGELTYGDEVSSVYTEGYWEKVIISKYNYYTNSYDKYEGYINSRFLADSSQNNYLSNTETKQKTSNYSFEDRKYVVISEKAYFHSKPNVKGKRNAYLVKGEEIYAIAESKYFVYIEFTNSNGLTTIGWILKDDLL